MLLPYILYWRMVFSALSCRFINTLVKNLVVSNKFLAKFLHPLFAKPIWAKWNSTPVPSGDITRLTFPFLW